MIFPPMAGCTYPQASPHPHSNPHSNPHSQPHPNLNPYPRPNPPPQMAGCSCRRAWWHSSFGCALAAPPSSSMPSPTLSFSHTSPPPSPELMRCPRQSEVEGGAKASPRPRQMAMVRARPRPRWGARRVARGVARGEGARAWARRGATSSQGLASLLKTCGEATAYLPTASQFLLLLLLLRRRLLLPPPLQP